MKRLRVGVLYGGRSGEHEVSLASAAAVFANLDRARYEPTAIRIEKDGRWLLADRPPSAASAADVIDQMRSEGARLRAGRDVVLPARPGHDTLMLIDRRLASGEDTDVLAAVTGLALDVIFPVLHGPFGEDGTVQGLLELANVAYVGCGVLASAAGMDKAIMKTLFRASGLRVTDWRVLHRHDWESRATELTGTIETALPYPVFVKPANMGSSVGVSKAHDRATLVAAIAKAFQFDRKVIVEVAVRDAREIEVAVLGNLHPRASVPGEIVLASEFYDYDSKYVNAGSRTEIPARARRHNNGRRAASGARRVRRDRRVGLGARRFPAQHGDRRTVRQRDQHAARLHRDQHVREVVDSEWRSVPRARRSARRARDRTPRREAEHTH